MKQNVNWPSLQAYNNHPETDAKYICIYNICGCILTIAITRFLKSSSRRHNPIKIKTSDFRWFEHNFLLNKCTGTLASILLRFDVPLDWLVPPPTGLATIYQQCSNIQNYIPVKTQWTNYGKPWSRINKNFLSKSILTNKDYVTNSSTAYVTLYELIDLSVLDLNRGWEFDN